jgi:hypothetical protein
MQEHSKIEETIDSIKDYINTQKELYVLKGTDKAAHIGSNVVSIVPIIFLSVLTFVMLSFALAYYLNTVLVSEHGGFLVVGGAYFVIVLILASVRKSLIAKPFRNKIIKELLRDHH